MFTSKPDCPGYRWYYPYLEIKLRCEEHNAINKLGCIFDDILSAQLVSREKKTASQQLRNLLENQLIQLNLDDQATHGALKTRLYTPKTATQFNKEADYKLTLSGLDQYWQQHTGPEHLKLNVSLLHRDKSRDDSLSIPYRGNQTLINAVEQVCWYFLRQTNFI